MTKKFLSLVLSLALVIGLIPMMSVSVLAAGGTTYLEDDFQSYDVGVYSSADSPLSVNGVSKWKVNSSVKVEVVSMSDANGNPTKALKYHNTKGAYQNISSGQNDYRFTANKTDSTAPSLSSLAGDVFVQEIDIWLPANIENADGSIDRKRPYKFYFGYGAVIWGDNLRISGINTGKSIESETWYNIKTTFDFTEYSKTGDPATYTVFVNDQAVYHNTLTSDYVEPSASMGYFIMMASRSSSAQTDANGSWEDVHVIFDNVKMYVNPAATTASSAYSDAQSVLATAKPTVNFTEMVLNLPSANSAAVSTENVKMTDSDGADVELASVTVGLDKKSIVIDPKADFEKGMKYNVEVSGIKDVYGRIIEDYSFSFTTADETNISATKPVFTKVDFEEGTETEVKALENGLINASYTLTNNAASAKSVVMLAVLKDEDTIKRFQLKSETIPAGATVNFNGGFKVENAETEKIEIFVWDDMCNMTPIVDKYTIDAESITPSIN